jgi:hypothetical protein
MGMTHDDLIADIERFAQTKNIAPATVTSRAVANSRLYARLKDGGSCTITVAARVRQFIEQNSSPSSAPLSEAS